MSTQLVKAISEMQEDEAVRLAQQALDRGDDPDGILAECQEAMKIVGDRFASGEYFVPELIMSGVVVKQVFDIVKPKMTAKKAAKGKDNQREKIVLGTVRGDVHNIGKDIVGFMLDTGGFEVHDLGVDVPEEKFVQAVKEVQPRVVALSGLLTSVYDSMKSTIEAIRNAGLRDGVKIMIGGGQMDEIVKNYVGADAYGKDAMSAVWLAKQWTEK